MTDTELLSENRTYGWPDITVSMRSADRQRFAKRIAALRLAQIERRAEPEMSAEYRSVAERNYAVTSRVRKALPVSVFNKHGKIVLSLEERILATACQIRKDREAMERATKEREMLSDFSAVGQDNFRHYVEGRLDGGQAAVPAGDTSNTLRCSSMTSTAEDHEWGAQAHNVIARKLIDRKDPATPDYQVRADNHFRAAEAHAAVGSPDTVDYQVRCARAVAACQRCNPSATFENKA